MIQKLIPEDNHNNDNASHKEIRAATQEAIDTTDDKELSVQEVKNVVASMRETSARGRWHTKRSIQGAGGNSTPLLNSNL